MRQLSFDEIYFGLEEGRIYGVKERRDDGSIVEISKGSKFVKYIVNDGFLKAVCEDGFHYYLFNIASGDISTFLAKRFWYTEN
jgi:hypothetical protein